MCTIYIKALSGFKANLSNRVNVPYHKILLFNASNRSSRQALLVQTAQTVHRKPFTVIDATVINVLTIFSAKT